MTEGTVLKSGDEFIFDNLDKIIDQNRSVAASGNI